MGGASAAGSVHKREKTGLLLLLLLGLVDESRTPPPTRPGGPAHESRTPPPIRPGGPAYESGTPPPPRSPAMEAENSPRGEAGAHSWPPREEATGAHTESATDKVSCTCVLCYYF